jgi:hypothetical protein
MLGGLTWVFRARGQKLAGRLGGKCLLVGAGRSEPGGKL